MKDKDILKQSMKDFERAENAETGNRKEAREDINFARLSKQWPTDVEKKRQSEGRPCLTINKLAPVIRQVVNDSRQNRPAIKVLPADSKADKDTADVLSGLIRNIEQSSNADVAYDTAIDQAVSGGFGYWRVNLSYINDYSENAGPEIFEQDIRIERVSNQFSVYGDPDSTEADSSDWMRCHVIEEVNRDDFKRKYPKAKLTDWNADDSSVSEGWKTEDKIRVAEYWVREKTTKTVIGVEIEGEISPETTIMTMEEFEANQEMIEKAGGRAVTLPRPINAYKVTQYIMTSAELLETNEWPGSYIPIIPVYGDEVNLEGERFFRSVIRDAKDANRMFNYWRSMATETVALAPKAPYIGKIGAFDEDSRWETANSENHAYLEYAGPDAPQRQPMPQIPAGAIQEAATAADDIKSITGLYDASLGARSNEVSGRAIMARQREGDVSTFHFIDNLTRAIRHSGKVIIDLIPKVYSTERMVRILGEDLKPENVPINGAQPDGDENLPGNSEITIHDLRVGKYDLTVTSGPSFSSRREEAATQMIELIRSYPDAAPLIGDILAKNLDWPGADEIAKRLESALPPEARGEGEEGGEIPEEVKQQIQEMSEALQEAGERLQQAENDNGTEQEKNDIEREKLAIERYRAETERLTASQEQMGPEQIQAIILQTLQDLATPDDLPMEAM